MGGAAGDEETTEMLYTQRVIGHLADALDELEVVADLR